MPHHPERHATQRTGWLRATVLGANDGIVSTASLLLGVAAAEEMLRMLAGEAPHNFVNPQAKATRADG